MCMAASGVRERLPTTYIEQPSRLHVSLFEGLYMLLKRYTHEVAARVTDDSEKDEWFVVKVLHFGRESRKSCPRLPNIHIASIRLSHDAVLALTASTLRFVKCFGYAIDACFCSLVGAAYKCKSTVSNVASRQPIIRAFVGNDFQDGDQGFSPLPAHSPQLDGQDCQKVCLVSYTIPKHDVAEGIVISKDPLVKVDGKPLGFDFGKCSLKKQKYLMLLWKDLAKKFTQLEKLLAVLLL
ncbi:hypothetical protein RHMOL_Rhmol04G0116700 [Rhododendron molle]|uniref:Uncharacterized protein n=2 Tax=Rhododendron molle TaxID=49168 RepID=A0ACC0NZE2_RHOML|nr:hypothetical protein RHMOL_Rhmol04G0116700 [Rhododendron molle]KAI8558695.1 hypothetical protein RHMOL_Rhmol04G0116700 [Rhododendron molle]